MLGKTLLYTIKDRFHGLMVVLFYVILFLIHILLLYSAFRTFLTEITEAKVSEDEEFLTPVSDILCEELAWKHPASRASLKSP